MTTQDLHDLKQLFEFAILTGDKPELTKSDCEMVVAAVDRVLKSEWRPIESVEQGPSILVACKGGFVGEAYADHEGVIRLVYSNAPPCFGGQATHWMPLPNPPKVSV